MIRKLISDQSGSPALEYALILGLVGLAIVTVMGNLSTSLGSMMGRAATRVDAIQFD